VENDRVDLETLVDMNNPHAIFTEAKRIVTHTHPQFRFDLVERTYEDVRRLFRGDYPGFRACNTKYHDLRHTMLVVLAMMRLLDGAIIEQERFTEKEVNIALVSALMHDTGYIQPNEDTAGTGAKYTLIHIARSIDFMKHYFSEDGYMKHDLPLFTDILNCTGVNTKISEIKFHSRNIELIGKMMGTADLLGQMADRLYLERLIFLYHEFVEGNVPGFVSEIDMLKKTICFYDDTKKRFVTELGSVYKYMIFHFQQRWNIARDLYTEAILSNITYLNFILKDHETDFMDYLRRGGIVQALA